MSESASVHPGARFRPRRDTRLSELLKAYPEMVEVLARFNKHFELLRRPTLRKLMTPLVTIEKAARTAEVDVDDLLAAIYTAMGEPFSPELAREERPADGTVASAPDWIGQVPDDRRVLLDVREQVRSGGEPYHRIMRAVASLKEEQILCLCNTFEPVPLYDLLAQRGFGHVTERRGPQEWWITFYRAARAGSEMSSTPPAAPAAEAGGPLQVDARGLEPPQPMARILEALPSLGQGGELRALTDRRPLLLYQKLEERGYKYATEEADGWFETRIWR